MIGSLFSGIGLLDLGLERAGLGSPAWHVESSAYCRSVLARHWPDATRYRDVRTFDAHTASDVRVICGGFPCQPHSVAGARRGVDDERCAGGLADSYDDATSAVPVGEAKQALGNAVVVACAELVGRAVLEAVGGLS